MLASVQAALPTITTSRPPPPPSPPKKKLKQPKQHTGDKHPFADPDEAHRRSGKAGFPAAAPRQAEAARHAACRRCQRSALTPAEMANPPSRRGAEQDCWILAILPLVVVCEGFAEPRREADAAGVTTERFRRSVSAACHLLKH